VGFQVSHYAFRIYHEGEIELQKQKFSPKTTHFKSKTLKSSSYRGMDKILLKFVHISLQSEKFMIEYVKKHICIQRNGQSAYKFQSNFAHTSVRSAFQRF
jgi:hypothetical protein